MQGQLVPVDNKLFYQAPTGERLQVKDDRAELLAEMLPLAIAGKLANAEARKLQRHYDDVLAQSASQFEDLAVKALDHQQSTINGLIGIIQSDRQRPVVSQQTWERGAQAILAIAVFLPIVFLFQLLWSSALYSSTRSVPQVQNVKSFTN